MENLNMSNKTLLLVLSIILVLFIIINYLINNLEEAEYDYESLSASTLMYQGEEIKDRKIYYTLEGIIKKYLSSYYGIDSNGNEIYLEEEPEYNYQEYYEALTEDYKNYLGKKGYTEVAEKFLNKFYIQGGGSEIEGHNYMYTYNIIKQIYKIDQNTYICELYSYINNKYGYIGIVINPNIQEYRIFILE